MEKLQRSQFCFDLATAACSRAVFEFHSVCGGLSEGDEGGEAHGQKNSAIYSCAVIALDARRVLGPARRGHSSSLCAARISACRDQRDRAAYAIPDITASASSYPHI